MRPSQVLQVRLAHARAPELRLQHVVQPQERKLRARLSAHSSRSASDAAPCMAQALPVCMVTHRASRFTCVLGTSHPCSHRQRHHLQCLIPMLVRKLTLHFRHQLSYYQRTIASYHAPRFCTALRPHTPPALNLALTLSHRDQ